LFFIRPVIVGELIVRYADKDVCGDSGMRSSIRYQLLVPLLTLLMGAVAMAVWAAAASAHRAGQQIEKQMHDVASTVSSVTFPRNMQTLNLMKGLSGAEFLLCDGQGRPRLDDRGEPMTTLPPAPEKLPPPSASWQEMRLGPRVKMGNDTYFCQGIRVGKDSGWILYIFYSESLWKDALWNAIRPALYFGVGGVVLSIALTILVAQRFTSRIQEMERRTRLIAGGDFSPMPLPKRSDELRDLAQSINDMAEKLARFQETVRQNERLRLLGQVSGGLAHQLRNGVAGARLAVQLHAREMNGQGDSETLKVALRQLSLVEMHLKRFLDLGRADGLRRERCSLSSLVDDTVTLLWPQCRHTGIDLQWQAPFRNGEKLADDISGDPDQLRHLLLNLIQNGIEAAGPGGCVEIRLRLPDAGASEQTRDTIRVATLEVYDSGSGPMPEIADRLFEPFVTGKPEGVGLGLAVAKQAVDVHGGRIGWHRDGERTCFWIELPLS
jgi:signal transduction histidine kinase